MADFAVTTDFSSGTTAVSTEVNQNFADVEKVLNGDSDSYAQVPALVPIGSIVAWLKTFASADSGTTDSTTADKLVQSGQNFTTTILAGMIVHNTTDDTYANVTAVDSDTTLSIDADIMVSGENFTIYKTPKIADGWIECNGSTVSDADSPYNSVAVPDLNSATQRFLRGATSSGTTGGADTVSHTHSIATTNDDSGTGGNPQVETNVTGGPSDTENKPAFYEVVWIIRIK